MARDTKCYIYRIVNLEKFDSASAKDIATYEGLELVKITNSIGAKTIWTKKEEEKK